MIELSYNSWGDSKYDKIFETEHKEACDYEKNFPAYVADSDFIKEMDDNSDMIYFLEKSIQDEKKEYNAYLEKDKEMIRELKIQSGVDPVILQEEEETKANRIQPEIDLLERDNIFTRFDEAFLLIEKENEID